PALCATLVRAPAEPSPRHPRHTPFGGTWTMSRGPRPRTTRPLPDDARSGRRATPAAGSANCPGRPPRMRSLGARLPFPGTDFVTPRHTLRWPPLPPRRGDSRTPFDGPSWTVTGTVQDPPTAPIRRTVVTPRQGHDGPRATLARRSGEGVPTPCRG